MVAAAVGLSLFPMGWLFPGSLVCRTAPEIANRRRLGGRWRVWRPVLSVPGHYIDLARGGLAGYLMAQACPDGPQSVLALGLLPGAVLLVKRDHRLSAPVCYVAGLTAALMPPSVGLLAIAMALMSAVGFESVGAFFAALAAGVAAATYLYSEDLFLGATGTLLAMAPLLTAYLRRRPLGILVRPSRRDAAAEEPKGEPALG